MNDWSASVLACIVNSQSSNRDGCAPVNRVALPNGRASDMRNLPHAVLTSRRFQLCYAPKTLCQPASVDAKAETHEVRRHGSPCDERDAVVFPPHQTLAAAPGAGNSRAPAIN